MKYIIAIYHDEPVEGAHENLFGVKGYWELFIERRSRGLNRRSRLNPYHLPRYTGQGYKVIVQGAPDDLAEKMEKAIRQRLDRRSVWWKRTGGIGDYVDDLAWSLGRVITEAKAFRGHWLARNNDKDKGFLLWKVAPDGSLIQWSDKWFSSYAEIAVYLKTLKEEQGG